MKISLRLKHSSPCGGSATSNGGSGSPSVVVGGGGKGVRVWVDVWRGGE